MFLSWIFRAEGALTSVSNRSLRRDFGRPVCPDVRFAMLFEALEKVCCNIESFSNFKSECTLDDIKRFCTRIPRPGSQFGGRCSGVVCAPDNC